VAAWLLVLSACAVLNAGSATANPGTKAVAPADDTQLNVSFTVHGKAVLAKLGSAVVLNEGRFDALIDLTTGAVTDGKLTLPPTRGTFLAFGFMPVNATTSFTQQGSATGTFNNGIADVTLDITLGISDTTVNGTPLAAGAACDTAQPVAVRLTGPLSLVGSSDFTSPFTIPDFRGCGTTENLNRLFDGLVAGPGNVLDTVLTLRCSGPSCT
jgi:hypothetical protein